MQRSSPRGSGPSQLILVARATRIGDIDRSLVLVPTAILPVKNTPEPESVHRSCIRSFVNGGAERVALTI